MKIFVVLFLISTLLTGCSQSMTGDAAIELTPKSTDDTQGSTGIHNPEELTSVQKLKLKSNEYRAKYLLTDAFSKLVDNYGNNYLPLYGVRNFRVVLHGVYYRGGANNVYNTVDGVRDNQNPLPASGLQNLCEQNFKESIYLYPTNFSKSPTSASCLNYKNEPNTLTYEQISPLTYKNNDKFLEKVFQVIKGQRQGPIYGHCWNGWHASGYVSAILLKQFCGYSDAKAIDYWIRNTDGNSAGYDVIQKQITAFKPVVKYQITSEESALICP